MHMALETRAWTRADLQRLPDDGNRYEVLAGELFVTPAPSAFHQRIVAWLSEAITPFVAAHGIGIVHQARSVMVVDDSEVEPDLMVLPRAPFAAWENAPTPILVVEVISKATRRRDLDEKRRFYLEKGVAEYWVVDRYARSVIRIGPSGSEPTSSVLTWTPAGSPATLELDVARMFSEVLPAPEEPKEVLKGSQVSSEVPH